MLLVSERRNVNFHTENAFFKKVTARLIVRHARHRAYSELNNHSFNLNGGLCYFCLWGWQWARELVSFCDFLILIKHSLWFHRIFSFLILMCLIRSNIAYLLPKIIHFGEVLSEHRSKEVISFSWRSVYLNIYWYRIFFVGTYFLFIITWWRERKSTR